MESVRVKAVIGINIELLIYGFSFEADSL